MKSSGLSPQDSSRLRVEVPLWLSWLNTSVSTQSQVYIDKAQDITGHKEVSNIIMQDINTSEREQSQTRENCFEVRASLLYVPAVPQHLQRVHTRTLEPLVPFLFPQEQHTQAY